jgi:microcin C transport system substrate-binding protein
MNKNNFFRCLYLFLLLATYDCAQAQSLSPPAIVCEDSLWHSIPLSAVNQPDKAIIHEQAFALIGSPKYPADFHHFAYVNPQAPKGGQMRFAIIGNYDNFNRFATRGAPERRSGQLYDTLYIASEDEKSSFYPLIALSIAHPADYQWAEVTLNPAATFHDGQPITADDVAFSFEKFMTEGTPQFRSYYQDIVVNAITPQVVRITMPLADRDRLLDLICSLRILPKHFWQHHLLSEPLATPPLGSGAYKVGQYQLGQYVIYDRVKDYWAKDLSVNRGQHNFDHLRYDYYLEDNIALEAFKAGAYDIREETQPKLWYTQYQGPNFTKQYIIKQQQAVEAAPNTQWLAFNLERPQFRDRRVRQAMTLAFDFEWLNRAFYYQSYRRPLSYFENTEYAAQGAPSTDELNWLLPFKSILPDEVFTSAYQLPPSQGDGFNRTNLLKAQALLRQAGFIMHNDQLIDAQTGKPFTFELLVYMGANLQYVLPYQKNLKRLGIDMKINMVDYTQINNRLRKRDYDMIPTTYYTALYPSSSLAILWGSHYLNSTWNASGLHNQAIDSLITEIGHHQQNQTALLSLGRALDRILTQEYAMLPMWYPAYTYYAYWNKFAMPDKKPTYSLGINSWWYDQQHAKQLPTHRQ